MKKILTSCFLLMMVIQCTGCAGLIIGGVAAGAGVLGGYALSKDTVKGEVDASYMRVWDEAIRVCKQMGTIKRDDVEAGLIEASIETSSVKIGIERLTPKTMTITVKARTRRLLPNVTLAQKIYNKIVLNAR